MLVSRRIVEEPNISIVPAGTDISFGINSQHFVLGFIESLRDHFSRRIFSRYVDARDVKTRLGSYASSGSIREGRQSRFAFCGRFQDSLPAIVPLGD
jgi:hypothetical protein